MAGKDANNCGKKVYSKGKIEKEDYDFLKEKIEEIYAANSDKQNFGEYEATEILHSIVPTKYRVSHSVVSRIHKTSNYNEYREIVERYNKNKMEKELAKKNASETYKKQEVVSDTHEKDICSTAADEQKHHVPKKETTKGQVLDTDCICENLSKIGAEMGDLLIVPASADGKYPSKSAGQALDMISATCNTIKKIINENVVTKENEICSGMNNLRNVLENLSSVLNENNRIYNENKEIFVRIYNENNESFAKKLCTIENKLDYLINMWEPSTSSAEI